MKKEIRLGVLRFVVALFSIVSLSACPGGEPLAAPEVVTAWSLVGDKMVDLDIVDYSQAEFGDFSAAPATFFSSTKLVPPSASVTIGFSQLLDGTTIEKIVFEQIDGKDASGKSVKNDHWVGEGNYKQKIPVVKEFKPVKGVIAVTSGQTEISSDKYTISYRPEGGVPSNPSDPVTKTPPPALHIQFKDAASKPTYLPSDSVIVVSLLVDKSEAGQPKVIKNVEGTEMLVAKAKAVGANPGPEVKFSDNKKIAASVMFRTEPFGIASAEKVGDQIEVKFNSAIKVLTSSNARFYVTSAALDSDTGNTVAHQAKPDDPTRVVLTSALVSGKTYRVTVTGVFTDPYDKPLSVGKQTATFTVP